MSVNDYIKELNDALARGDASEHTHRPALKTLLEASGHQLSATNEPKMLERDNKPDYIVRRRSNLVGFIEAKDIDTSLQATLKTPQLKRYLEALHNLILTNYVDFIWLADGQEQLKISLGEINKGRIRAHQNASTDWQHFIASFANQVSPTLTTPLALAKQLGGQTRLLRDLVQELRPQDSDLDSQYQTFRQLLVPDLADAEFADMYAQTAAYGLFTARVFAYTPLFGAVPDSLKQQDFSLEQAAYLIPPANPFLRQFFQHIASPNLNPQLRWLIEQIASGLRYADMDKILHAQGNKAGFEDPVFHFYESFLAEYDRALRESRGVYYTPEPVVDFIVRAVDDVLRDQFAKSTGLADPSTLILDPATGTATFLRKVIAHIHQHFVASHNAGLWNDYVRERLLPRIFGFELMMAPYTVAHLKLALQLQAQGFSFADKERLHVFLTNTLDTIEGAMDMLMAQWIAQENAGAEAVKRDKPVQVVLGNPPYSGESRNKSLWISQLLEAYKKEPNGGKLQERNSKWLNDDYVKFIRFAHDRIARTGHGIVAFITNHSWLDNPTFRGMRASLMRDFDQIYILDLHGNSKKQERTPATLKAQGEDKNVFDIEQGVAITLLVKTQQQPFALSATPAHEGQTSATIHHAELWGSRDWKYDWLKTHRLQDTQWQILQPSPPNVLFVPRNESLVAEYQAGWKITHIMPVNSVGIVTARDALTIHFTPAALRDTLVRFVALPVEEAREKFKLGEDVQDWQVARAQQDVRDTGMADERIVTIAYRPFDSRYTYYTGNSKGFHCRARGEVMRHFLETDNLGLVIGRAGVVTGSAVWDVCFISSQMTEFNLYRRGGNNLFPLWLLSKSGQGAIKPNLAPKFLEQLAAALGVASQQDDNHSLPAGVSAEQVLAYLYAVLHAPSYRRRYAEFLKSDFPHIPIAACAGSALSFAETWAALLPLGQALINLHLLKQVDKRLKPSYPQAGTHAVDKVRYDDKNQRVYINASQYFSGVPVATWQCKIGGYVVCEKWLKDRKGRTLTLDEIEHYQSMVAALTQTLTVMQEIDRVVIRNLWSV